MNKGSGIKREQCKVLGIQYPPSKGWKKQVIGMEITSQQAICVLELKNKRHLSKTQNVKLFDTESCVTQENLKINEHRMNKTKRAKFTMRFIQHFLDVNSTYCCAKTLKTKMNIISRDSYLCDKEILFSAIKKMPYKDFLQTPYWKAIAENQKRCADRKCVLCGSEKYLNVHHTTYKNHGNEILHLEDLITVCRDCHKRIHNIE